MEALALFKVALFVLYIVVVGWVLLYNYRLVFLAALRHRRTESYVFAVVPVLSLLGVVLESQTRLEIGIPLWAFAVPVAVDPATYVTIKSLILGANNGAAT